MLWNRKEAGSLADALSSWKGYPTDMRLHMSAEVDGEPEPSSASGRDKRDSARTILQALQTNLTAAPILWRGGGIYQPDPRIPLGFSEDKSLAKRFSHGGDETMYRLEGATGLQISTYTFDSEHEWLIPGPLYIGEDKGKYIEVRQG